MSIEEREEHREYGENEVRSELMRAGVRARVARLAQTTGAGARRWSPPVLMAVLSAGAFGQFWDPENVASGPRCWEPRPRSGEPADRHRQSGHRPPW